MEKLGVDILEYGGTYMLLGIDYYTRFMMGSVIETKEARTIEQELIKWFKKWGNPEELIVDQGLEFDNKWVEEMCVKRKIRRKATAVGNHKANGRVERPNRTIREYFRKNDPEKIKEKKRY